MKLLTVGDIARVINDPSEEGAQFDQIIELRGRVEPRLGTYTADTDRRWAVDRAIKAVWAILVKVLMHGDVEEVEAAHGIGHWTRDFAHMLRLAQDAIVPEDVIVPALVGGTLHDIGSVFVDRYAEKNRAVRHAEAGALVVRAAALETGALTEAEADLVAYVIAAHTHYLQPQEVKCADGVVRTVRPYTDMFDGKPVEEVWLARWADRLDVNGPCFPARHYLTLVRDHYDYGTEGFYKTSFTETMRPLLRTGEAIKAAGGQRTMLEHLKMFASSQTSESVYGKHDAGVMLTLRDAYREQLEHIIHSVAHPTDVDIARVLKAWTVFLGANIEPTVKGRMAAHNLALGFRKLEPDIQRAWACGFRTIMTEYLGWADRMLVFLDGRPAESLRITGNFEDIRNVIRPDRAWVKVLAG